MAAMREEMIANGVKFLQHPNVQATPLSERVSFLERKGLTHQEIQEAIERTQAPAPASSSSSSSATSSATAPAGSSSDGFDQFTSNTAPVNTMAPPPPPNHPSAPAPSPVAAVLAPTIAASSQLLNRKNRSAPAYVKILWTVSSLVGAATLMGLLWRFALHSGLFAWGKSFFLLDSVSEQEKQEKRQQLEQQQREQEEQTTKALVDGLEQVSVAIDNQTKQMNQLISVLETKEQQASGLDNKAAAQTIEELRAEVSSLKVLVNANQGSTKVDSSKTTASNASKEENKNESATSSIPSSQLDESTQWKSSVTTNSPSRNQNDSVSTSDAKADKVEHALTMLQQDNTLDALTQASSILIMYVKNLVENPDVPRYRRISPGNSNFKDKIEPLQYHEEFLLSIGFATTGVAMEWRWHQPPDQVHTNMTIMKAVLKTLQCLRTATPEDDVKLPSYFKEQLNQLKRESMSVPAQTMKSTPTSAGSSSPSTGVSEFMAKLAQQQTQKTAASTEATTEATTSSSPPASSALVSEDIIDPTEEEEEEEDKAPASTKSPTYPDSFKEVMEMIKRGETVPGIQEIDDEKLSSDATALLQEDPVAAATPVVAKPWMR